MGNKEVEDRGTPLFVFFFVAKPHRSRDYTDKEVVGFLSFSSLELNSLFFGSAPSQPFSAFSFLYSPPVTHS